MRRASFLSMALAAAACAWPRPKADPTAFFVLESRPPAAPASGKRSRLALAEIDVPAYLRNPRIVTSRGGSEITYAEYDRWAEPLGQGLARAVRDDLSDVADVRTTPDARAAYDARLTIRVSSFEGAPGGIRLEAAWELAPKSGTPIRGVFKIEPGTVAWNGKDFAVLTRLLSDGVAQLCAELRRALAAAQK